MKKQYIIVGDNNFWYSTIDDANANQLGEEIAQVCLGIKQGMYEAPAEPTELFVYEITGKYETVQVEKTENHVQ